MDDPDWMNDFKTPGEGVVMLSSSSPSSSSSREANRKTDSAIERAGKEAQDDNGRGKSDDEDSPLITAYVRSGKGSRGSGRGAGSVVGRISSTSSMEAKQTPGKRKGAGVTRKRMRDDVQDQVDDDDDGDGNDGDDDEKETVVISSKRSRGVKRALESDEDVEWSPSKIRKVSASPLVKGDGNGAQPKSSRKGRRVSFSGEDEGMKQKKVKRTVSSKDSVDKEEDEDSLPLSVLVKKSKKVTNIDGGSQVENIIDTKVEQRVTASALEENSSDVPSLSLLRNASDKVVADRDGALLVKGEAEDEIGAETSEKKAKSRASSSMPVVFAERVQRTKVLLECEGDAMDLSGDMGAVGRFSTSSGSGNVDDELLLDLKGILYKTTIVPTNTFFVVNVGQTEAKVEAIMNDFMQLRPDLNQVEDETVVEGTLEGFSFDLETEGDPLGTPATASGPVDSDADEESNPKKKSPTKAQKQRKAGKGSNAATNTRPKGTGKGAPKKPRPKAKTGAKKPSKAKPSKAKPSKAKPSVVKSK